MSIRTRKLVGAVVLIVVLVVYAFVAMAAAVVLQVNQASKLAELAFYAVAGLAWVVPAGAVISWMSRTSVPSDDRR